MGSTTAGGGSKPRRKKCPPYMKLVKTTLLVPVYDLSDVSKSVKGHLNDMTLSFIPKLKGVPLSYTNVVEGDNFETVDPSGIHHLPVKATFQVFQPTEGDVMAAKVVKKLDDGGFVAVGSVNSRLSVRISVPVDQPRSEEARTIEIGDEIIFSFVKMVAKRKMIILNGEFVRLYKKRSGDEEESKRLEQLWTMMREIGVCGPEVGDIPLSQQDTQPLTCETSDGVKKGSADPQAAGPKSSAVLKPSTRNVETGLKKPGVKVSSTENTPKNGVGHETSTDSSQRGQTEASCDESRRKQLAQSNSSLLDSGIKMSCRTDSVVEEKELGRTKRRKSTEALPGSPVLRRPSKIGAPSPAEKKQDESPVRPCSVVEERLTPTPTKASTKDDGEKKLRGKAQRSPARRKRSQEDSDSSSEEEAPVKVPARKSRMSVTMRAWVKRKSSDSDSGEEKEKSSKKASEKTVSSSQLTSRRVAKKADSSDSDDEKEDVGRSKTTKLASSQVTRKSTAKKESSDSDEETEVVEGSETKPANSQSIHSATVEDDSSDSDEEKEAVERSKKPTSAIGQAVRKSLAKDESSDSDEDEEERKKHGEKMAEKVGKSRNSQSEKVPTSAKVSAQQLNGSESSEDEEERKKPEEENGSVQREQLLDGPELVSETSREDLSESEEEPEEGRVGRNGPEPAKDKLSKNILSGSSSPKSKEEEKPAQEESSEEERNAKETSSSSEESEDEKVQKKSRKAVRTKLNSSSSSEVSDAMNNPRSSFPKNGKASSPSHVVSSGSEESEEESQSKKPRKVLPSLRKTANQWAAKKAVSSSSEDDEPRSEKVSAVKSCQKTQPLVPRSSSVEEGDEKLERIADEGSKLKAASLSPGKKKSLPKEDETEDDHEAEKGARRKEITGNLSQLPKPRSGDILTLDDEAVFEPFTQAFPPKPVEESSSESESDDGQPLRRPTRMVRSIAAGGALHLAQRKRSLLPSRSTVSPASSRAASPGLVRTVTPGGSPAAQKAPVRSPPSVSVAKKAHDVKKGGGTAENDWKIDPAKKRKGRIVSVDKEDASSDEEKICLDDVGSSDSDKRPKKSSRKSVAVGSKSAVEEKSTVKAKPAVESSDDADEDADDSSKETGFFTPKQPSLNTSVSNDSLSCPPGWKLLISRIRTSATCTDEDFFAEARKILGLCADTPPAQQEDSPSVLSKKKRKELPEKGLLVSDATDEDSCRKNFTVSSSQQEDSPSVLSKKKRKKLPEKGLLVSDAADKVSFTEPKKILTVSADIPASQQEDSPSVLSKKKRKKLPEKDLLVTPTLSNGYGSGEGGKRPKNHAHSSEKQTSRRFDEEEETGASFDEDIVEERVKPKACRKKPSPESEEERMEEGQADLKHQSHSRKRPRDERESSEDTDAKEQKKKKRRKTAGKEEESTKKNEDAASRTPATAVEESSIQNEKQNSGRKDKASASKGKKEKKQQNEEEEVGRESERTSSASRRDKEKPPKKDTSAVLDSERPVLKKNERKRIEEETESNIAKPRSCRQEKSEKKLTESMEKGKDTARPSRSLTAEKAKKKSKPVKSGTSEEKEPTKGAEAGEEEVEAKVERDSEPLDMVTEWLNKEPKDEFETKQLLVEPDLTPITPKREMKSIVVKDSDTDSDSDSEGAEAPVRKTERKPRKSHVKTTTPKINVRKSQTVELTPAESKWVRSLISDSSDEEDENKAQKASKPETPASIPKGAETPRGPAPDKKRKRTSEKDNHGPPDDTSMTSTAKKRKTDSADAVEPEAKKPEKKRKSVAFASPLVVSPGSDREEAISEKEEDNPRALKKKKRKSKSHDD